MLVHRRRVRREEWNAVLGNHVSHPLHSKVDINKTLDIRLAEYIHKLPTLTLANAPNISTKIYMSYNIHSSTLDHIYSIHGYSRYHFEPVQSSRPYRICEGSYSQELWLQYVNHVFCWLYDADRLMQSTLSALMMRFEQVRPYKWPAYQHS